MSERLDSAARREQIAEAALAIVLEEGVGALTARRVARRVGVTAPALYRHYQGKADILLTVLDLVAALDAEIYRKAKEAATPLAALESVFRQNVALMQRYRALPILFLSDLMWIEEPRLGERLRQDCRRCRAEEIALLRQGQALGQIRNDLAAEELANSFLAAYVMLGLMNSRRIDEVDVARQADVNWRLFEKAVRP